MGTPRWSVKFTRDTPLHPDGYTVDVHVFVQRCPEVILSVFVRRRWKTKKKNNKNFIASLLSLSNSRFIANKISDNLQAKGNRLQEVVKKSGRKVSGNSQKATLLSRTD